MANAIAKIEPLPVPAPLDPAPRVPASVTEMGERVFENYQPHPDTGAIDDCLVLMPERMLTAQQRIELENHKGHTAKLLEMTPEHDQVFGKKVFGKLSALILTTAKTRAGPEAAEARLATYEMAVEDLPYWSVEIAIKKWHRGQCDRPYVYDGPPEVYDYRWAPELADLRKIAMRETWPLKQRIKLIDRILAAVPFRDWKNERPPLSTTGAA